MANVHAFKYIKTRCLVGVKVLIRTRSLTLSMAYECSSEGREYKETHGIKNY